ncbi:glycosyltransferase family 2 protein [Mucilaginibacter terrenus]|uniref:Glycosyltransferase family 2 protein n=1 Tax=Mucilaginibacter terrenus TaxID=2482727 RepID=A0A3E2NUB8_9SPHI|nr:glycosyltransferase family 2 protein [Mucilaginibacter terrenus]RFZ84604.1 glycosyltransferase family 2 protein [Mucilaginibacter terrenus]
MSNLPKVAVVILNWNGQKYLEQFLPSVLASSYPNLQVVVGDNASTDGSVAFLKGRYPDVAILENSENYGFTGGYNRVLSGVDADYYVLLNSDVEVEPGWIEPVIKLMESDAAIAAAGPKLRSYHQKSYFEYAGAAGGYIDKYGYPFCRGRIFTELEEDNGQYDKQDEIFWASGAALFIKKVYWDEGGGFDESFFAHMEEIDLCWRLKNMGYKIVYCPQSVVYHVGGGTLNAESPFKTYLNFRNNLLLLKNNLPGRKAFRIIFIRFWLDLLALVKFLADGKAKNAWAISKAHRNFVRGLFQSKKLQPKAIAVPQRNHIASHTYKRSIVWDFFVGKKKRFSELDKQDFS